MTFKVSRAAELATGLAGTGFDFFRATAFGAAIFGMPGFATRFLATSAFAEDLLTGAFFAAPDLGPDLGADLGAVFGFAVPRERGADFSDRAISFFIRRPAKTKRQISVQPG